MILINHQKKKKTPYIMEGGEAFTDLNYKRKKHNYQIPCSPKVC